MFACCTSRDTHLFVLALALIALALIPPAAAHASTCYVPSLLYPTIQSAVNNCPDSNVQLAGKTFYENVTIIRAISISGSDGTVVDGGGRASVFTVGARGMHPVVFISNLTVTNGRSGSGGGIFNVADLTLNGVTVSGNSAYNGGGIENCQYDGDALAGILQLNFSTVSGNSANYFGGGIDQCNSNNYTSLVYATVAFNVSNTGGLSPSQPGGGVSTSTGSFNIKNTILDSNTEIACSFICVPIPDDCFGTLYSQDYNLISVKSNDCTISGLTTHTITDMSAKLGPLMNNGGATKTHALLPDSPAIDWILRGNNGCFNPTADQRGWARPFPPGGACDIGAYERGAFLNLPLISK